MKGFSLTTIVLEESIEKALLSDVETASWQKPVQPRTINVVPSTLDSARVDFTPSANPQVGDYVAQVTGALIDLEEHLNALDAKVGDGDTGSTFAAGAREIAERLERQQLPLNDLPTLFALIGERLTVVMGGSSGVLMSIFFTAAGQKLGQGASVAEALNAGLEQMKFTAAPMRRPDDDRRSAAGPGGAAGRTGESAGRFRRGAGRGGSHLPVKQSRRRTRVLSQQR